MTLPDKKTPASPHRKALLTVAATALAVIALTVLGIPQWGYMEIKALRNQAWVATAPIPTSGPDYGFSRRPHGGPNGEDCNANLPPLAEAPSVLDKAAVRGLPTDQVPCVPLIRTSPQ